MKDLYIILREQILKSNTPFICNNIEILKNYQIITEKEYRELLRHFKTQFPKSDLHPEFYNHPLFCAQSGLGVWFKYNSNLKEGLQIRIDFIDKIILTLS